MNKNSFHQNGFISIIALGIFALLSVVGLIVQAVIMDTIQNVKNTNNYYRARDVADSVSEYLQYELNNHQAVFNKAMTCKFGSFDQGETPHPDCDKFNTMVNAGTEDEMNVEIVVDIKGFAESGEKFTDCPSSYVNGCYTVPFPGTGDASELCNLYTPFNGDYVSANLTGTGADQIEHYNYSCNWNKLTFGSNQTDRVTIPLHYENVSDIVVNPFHIDNGDRAQLINLRIRTACKPCSERQHACEPGQDESFCYDDDRYELDDSLDSEVIVQWQFSGLCNDIDPGVDQECGLIPYIPTQQEIDGGTLSAILGQLVHNDGSYSVLTKSFKGIDTRTYNSAALPNIGGNPRPPSQPQPRLLYLKEGSLTLFLGDILIDVYDKNIPYLEYQLVTDKPVGDANTRLEVSVNIEGNIFQKSLSISSQQPLLDFAVQN